MASELGAFVPLEEYQLQRTRFFPSLQSAFWQLRQHRAALDQADAVRLIRRHTYVHPDRFDQVIENATKPTR